MDDIGHNKQPEDTFNMWMKQQSRHENMTYVALWGMLFAAPLLSLYIRTVSDTGVSFDWREVMMVWRQYTVFLLLFLLHNFLLAPMLVYRQKKALYASIVGCVLVAFVTYQCSTRPDHIGKRPHPMAQHDQQSAQRHSNQNGNQSEEMHEGMHEAPPPHDGEFFDHEPPPFADDGQPMHAENKGDMRRKEPHPGMFAQHDIIAIIILVLMFGMNLGIKLFFKTRGDQKKMAALEKENLEQQLEYLKYQINPHFFMNTLNNIHALVDIDPEKAKDTILELSKMMRFVLYEGDKHGVPLTREFDFIRNYVTLMKLRYTDKVKITVDLPTEAPDKQIPPLMLITFIENAFKHGISYQHESFIEVKAAVEGSKLCFQCRNSKADKPNEEKGGVGLTNVKQRLHLLYDNNFTLNIQDEPDIYNVELIIPLT